MEYYHDCLYPDDDFKILKKPNAIKIGIGYRGIYFYTNPVFSRNGFFQEGDFDSKPNGGGGVFAKVYLKDKWSVELGANFLPYHFSTLELKTPASQFSKVDIDLKILEVPLSISYYFDLPFRPHIFGGYSFDFLIRPEVVETPFNMKNESTKVVFKNENFGLHIGLGISKTLNPNAEILLQLKYTREHIRIKTHHFDLKKLDFVTAESKLNPNRLEVSTSYNFLLNKR